MVIQMSEIEVLLFVVRAIVCFFAGYGIAAFVSDISDGDNQ